jgi:hypothetical protein
VRIERSQMNSGASHDHS